MTYECPHCGNELKVVDNVVFDNVRTYDSPATMKTKCCGLIVKVHRVTSFRITPTSLTEDDWGNYAKKPLKVYA